MKKSTHFATAAIVAAMFTAASAYAEPPSAGAQPEGTMMRAAPSEAPQQGGPGGGMKPMDPQAQADHKAEEELAFKNRKEEAQLRLKNFIDRLEKSKACIDAAADMEALMKCSPGGGHMGGGMMMHPDHGRGPQGGGQQQGGGEAPQGGPQGGPPAAEGGGQ